MTIHKTIHFSLYDPTSGPHIFGKPKANEPTSVRTINCSNSENCSLYKKGECAALPVLFGSHCPYGYFSKLNGPTKKAKSFRSWQEEQRQKYQGAGRVNHATKKLAIVGDFVYIPYSHVNMNETLPFDRHGGFMRSGTDFLKLSDFTLENIQKILDFRPQALMGGEITSYRKEELPKFLYHLQEVFPLLYSQLLDLRPDYVQKFGLDKPKNYVGRTALLKTVNPCTFVTDGYEGKYKVTWVWDGTKATTNSEHAYGSWGRLKDYDKMTVEIVPGDKTEMTITDNSQVGPQTVFTN